MLKPNIKPLIKIPPTTVHGAFGAIGK